MPPKGPAFHERSFATGPEETAPAPTFVQCFDTIFKDWFDLDSWGIWRIVAKAIFAEPLTSEELATFAKITGRTIAQDTPAKEVWLACGRRAGKDYFIAALVVWLACFRRYRFNKGELGRIMLLAVDSDQADVLYAYVTGLVDSIPRLRRMVIKRSVKFGMRRTEFSTGVEILIKVADKRRVRGRTVVAVVADEVAHWFSEEHHSNPDVEVLNAIRPGMLGVPGALLIGISSPYRRAGELFETDQRVWAKNGSPILFIRAATWVMRPDTPDHHARYPTFTAELEAERERDPAFFAAEFGAEYRLDLEDYLTLEQVQSVTVERSSLPYTEGMKCHAFIDTAGGEGQDSQVLAIGMELPEQRGAVCSLTEWKPPFDAMSAAIQVAEICAQYHVTTIVGDNYGGAQFASMLKQVSRSRIRYVVEEKKKTLLYRGFAGTVTGHLIELLGAGETAQRGLRQIIRLEKRNAGEVIDHPKSEHDDIANAIAGLALLLCKSRGFMPFSFPVTKDFVTGQMHIGGAAARPTPIPPSEMRNVHPHERVEKFTTEKDVRLRAKAKTWRDAWDLNLDWNAGSGREKARRRAANDYAAAVTLGWTPESVGWTPPTPEPKRPPSRPDMFTTGDLP